MRQGNDDPTLTSEEAAMPPEVSTSATTDSVPSSADRPGVTVIYPVYSEEQISYTVQAHPPTPRDDK